MHSNKFWCAEHADFSVSLPQKDPQTVLDSPLPLSSQGQENGETYAYVHSMKKFSNAQFKICGIPRSIAIVSIRQNLKQDFPQSLNACEYLGSDSFGVSQGWFCTFYLYLEMTSFRLTCIFPWNVLAVTKELFYWITLPEKSSFTPIPLTSLFFRGTQRDLGCPALTCGISDT